MAPQPISSLRDRSAVDSPSYALRAALAERLAGHREMMRDGGQADAAAARGYGAGLLPCSLPALVPTALPGNRG